MGLIRAIVTDENGRTIGREFDFSSAILSGVDREKFPILSYVDPYGDTIFNQLQVSQLCIELSLLKKMMENDHDQLIVEQLELLCKKSLVEPHLYLKFLGD